MDKTLKVGARAELIGKDVQGTVAYVGMTSFAVGKWVGVILDEPKGKNNGTIKGQSYFECGENYGTFVRSTQLRILSSANSSANHSQLSGISDRNSIGSANKKLLLNREGKDGNTSCDSSMISHDVSRNGSTKNASFVETGFLEILQPEFKSSQPIHSPSFNSNVSFEEKSNNLLHQKTIDDQRLQIVDLTEKLETLKQRRSEDKERLREFDKMKIQFEQLQEFRTKIIISQGLLQKDLQRAKHEAKEAIEARERHAQEMSELSDNVEFITLDKEMAEEKADTLQLELDSAKDRIEELQVDLELLRSEMQNRTENLIGSTTIEETTILAHEFKELKKQNNRLKDTLVRLRDLSAHEKHDIQKLTKELEMKKSEVAELERTKEKLSVKIDELEATIADLQEQVDAALGAEEMVEQLADKKLQLEDKVKILEEEISQLEALEEVHEQLVESNHDLELDLREELDLAYAAKKEAQRERDAVIETICDRDQTITKFRELVQKLHDQNEDLHKRFSTEKATEIVDVNKKFQDGAINFTQIFAETKANTRAIDIELRQIELKEATEHICMLLTFMPNSFLKRGGDHDSMLALLLISRLISKCNIILTQARERFPVVKNVTQAAIMQSYEVQQYGFKCRLLHYANNLQCVLHQIFYGLNSCQPDTLLRAGNSLPEMVAHEKTIDHFIELLKLNQLDENSTTDNIEKCVNFFSAMNSVLLSSENIFNETQIIRDCIAALDSACDSIRNDAAISHTIIRGINEESDAKLSIDYLTSQTELIKQNIKLIRRRLPQDVHITKCGIANDILNKLNQFLQAISQIMAIMNKTSKLSVQTLLASNENDNPIESHFVEASKFYDFLTQMFERVYEQEDRGPLQNFKSILGPANTTLQHLSQYLQEKEYEIMSNQNKTTTSSPITVRAQQFKKQLEQENVLAVTLENREEDIKQMKLAAKLKQNELSEMQIRKDLAEKKLAILQNEYEHTVNKWKRKYEDTKSLLDQKMKEFEEDLDHLQKDINSLESEKIKLREKLKFSNVSNNKCDGLSVTMSSTDIFSQSNATEGVTSLAVEEYHLLKRAFKNERNSRLRLQAQTIRETLKKFDPIHVPQPKDKRISQLECELTKIKHAWALSLLQTVPQNHSLSVMGGSIPKSHRNQLSSTGNISARANDLKLDVIMEYLYRHPHRTAHTQFAVFPTIEVNSLFTL